MYGIARNDSPAFPRWKWCLFRLGGYVHTPGAYPASLPSGAALLDELHEKTDVETLLRRMGEATAPGPDEFLAFLQASVSDPYLQIYLDNVEGLAPARGMAIRSAAYYTLYHRVWGAIVFTIAFRDHVVFAQSMGGEVTARHALRREDPGRTSTWEWAP